MAVQAIEPEHLAHDEAIARCAIFPKYLVNGVFSDASLLSPVKLDKNVKRPRLTISVVSRTKLNDEDGLHAYGCRTASVQNQRFAQKHGRSPTDQRSFYRGYYEIVVASATNVAVPGYTIQVVSVPEGGEDAHCEIRLIPDAAFTPDQLKDARTEVLLDLADCLAGPSLHLCYEDQTFAEALSSHPLPVKKAIR